MKCTIEQVAPASEEEERSFSGGYPMILNTLGYQTSDSASSSKLELDSTMSQS